MNQAVSENTSALKSGHKFEFIKLSQLHRSPQNMRTVNPSDSDADHQLHVSIGEVGLLQNLVVYKRDDGDYEVPAGGRRFGSLELHVKEGKLDPDALVPCVVTPSEEAYNITLAENYARAAAHPADTATAFLQLENIGMSVSAIAKVYGITLADVEKHLRLGNLNKTLMRHFKADKMSFDQVLAYAATPNTKKQLAVFKLLGEDVDCPVWQIKQEMSKDRQTSESPLARFVTIDAYHEAGGSSEHDLFGEEYMLANVELLTELAQSKLNEEAKKIEGWGWVETSTSGITAGYSYDCLPKTQLPIPADEKTKLDDLEAQMRVIDDGDNWDGEKYYALEDEHEKLEHELEDKYTEYSEKDMSYGGCIVTFTEDGDLYVIRGLLKREDKKRFNSRDESKPDSADEKPVSVTKASNDDLSGALSSDLGLSRRSAIQASLVSSPKHAISLLHFQICVSMLSSGMDRWFRMMDVSASEVSNALSTGDQSDTKAATTITKAYGKLDLGWLSIKSPVKRFEAFRSLSASKRNALVSYCSALTLMEGNELPKKNPLMDSIAGELELDYVEFWRPNAENYFKRLSKPYLLALGKKWYGAAWHKEHSNDTKKALVLKFDQLFNGPDDALNEKEKVIRDTWLPPQF